MVAARLLGNMRCVCHIRGIYEPRAISYVVCERNGNVFNSALSRYRVFFAIRIYAFLGFVYPVVFCGNAFFLCRAVVK